MYVLLFSIFIVLGPFRYLIEHNREQIIDEFRILQYLNPQTINSDRGVLSKFI